MRSLLSLVSLAFLSAVTASNRDVDWNRKQECWTRKQGVCVKNVTPFQCPFADGSTWWKGCPFGYVCCVPPKKSLPHRPITTQACGFRAGGETTATDRVIGGFRAKRGEFPWQALVRCMGRPHCGGSIISNRWVITAAHCVTLCAFPTTMTVSTGLIQFGASTSVQTFEIEKKEVHKQFNNPPYANDIALFRLRTPIRFDNFSRPICLPRRHEQFVDHVCSVSGWGWNGRKNAQFLTALNLPTLSHKRCLKAPESGKYIGKYNLCAGFKAGERDACQGDSGGPLACRMNSGQWLLSGVMSWGEGCALANEPAVFTRTTHYLDWIEQKTGLRWA